MGQTIAQKILSNKVERPVDPGEIIKVEYDLVGTNDASTPETVNAFEALDGEIADPDRLVVIPDHRVPSHNERSQRLYNICKEFSEEHGIEKFYPQRDTGLMHAVVPEDGLVKPGDVFIGADSHSTTPGAMGVFATGMSYTDTAFAWVNGWTWFRVPETVRIEYTGNLNDWVRGKDLILKTIGSIGSDGAVYDAIEYGGPAVEELPMDDRFSMSNMAIEAGGKVGFVDPDEVTRQYVDQRIDSEYHFFESDSDANFRKEVTIDCDNMEPQVAVPHLPENTEPISDVAGIEIDQAVVGSCTNCRIEDLQQAAEILEGNRIDPGVRMIITPGTQHVQSVAYENGWMETFHKAGANIGSPGCGACFGEHIGVLDEDERAIATTNRNFIGRMGPESSKVYLSNSAVAAASAITGEITHPEEVV